MKANRILQNSGWWILSVLSLIPFVLWATQNSLSYNFTNLSLFATSIGTASGLPLLLRVIKP